MLLTISTTHDPATDLGYLLHKHPAKVQSFPLSFGDAHVYYPHATSKRCTAALLLEVDPIQLVRGKRRGDDGLLDQYVNDRPYAASSLLSTAIAQVFGTALNGRCEKRPELVTTPLSLEARLASLPGGTGLVTRLFEPLGYEVELHEASLDPAFSGWGVSPYVECTLRATRPLHELLSHLYVLVPVLDDAKHYWVADDEVEKLLRRGGDWLRRHPLKETITRRYLKHQGRLVKTALARLVADQEGGLGAVDGSRTRQEEQLERPLSLNEQRYEAVLAELRACGAGRVVDLGCGEGKLVRALAREGRFDHIAGLDVSARALAVLKRRIERMPEHVADRIEILHGSLLYADPRLRGFDAAAVVEVIEHIDEARLGSFERVLFAEARPRAVIVTTPNAEYNVRFETLAAHTFRHRDHRFEWTRAQFETWAERVAGEHGYALRLGPIGPVDGEVGPPTQMGVFTR